jgi:hypothetical protein
VSNAALAASNSQTSFSDGARTDLQDSQYSEGAATAAANATVWNAWGAVSNDSSATGNAASATSFGGDINIYRTQDMRGDATAATNTQTGRVGEAYSSASAAGNVTDVAAEFGTVSAQQRQDNSGRVIASIEADHCCVNWPVGADAAASANSASISGYTSTIYSDTEQHSTGPSVTAAVDLYAGYTGDAIGAANAAANTLTIANEWGYVQSQAVQRSSSDVTAASYVTLGGDFLGIASASAFGVGNSAAVSNIGSDTALDIDQNNSGAVGAFAAVAGQGGDTATATSAAYGNVITAGLCATCSNDGVPALNAESRQVNSGPVYASSVIQTPGARNVAGSAVAIGNAASYRVGGH